MVMDSWLDVELFIESVKQRPILWDMDNPKYYTDKKLKHSVWMEVCSIMYSGFEEKSKREQNDLVSRLMKRWKGLRDSYLKSVKKKNSSSKTYIYTRQMSFLGTTVSRRATGLDEEQESPSEEEEKDDGPPEEVTLPPPHRPKRTRTSNVANTSAVKRRVMDEENILQLLREPDVIVQPGPEPDDDKSFFDSLLPFVKTLPLDAKMDFRYRVMGLVREMRNPAATSTGCNKPAHPKAESEDLTS